MLKDYKLRQKNYIVVEGPLGVGKTSLAMLLAEKINGKTILEETEGNPFLTNFYKDPIKFAFQTQLFFILRRFQKQEEINQIDIFKRVIISDFLFDKDRIFARLNLDDREFSLYEQIFHLLKVRTLKPNLVIFLQARTDILKERIKKRDRDYEKSINLKYLDQINQALMNFFFITLRPHF
jgi:deoxyadenosine/deoxycytidine kinase